MSTEGYSGADLELLSREAAMKPVRRLMEQLKQLDESTMPPPPQPPESRSSKLHSRGGKNEGIDIGGMLKADPVTMMDVESALATTKSSSMEGQSHRCDNDLLGLSLRRTYHYFPLYTLNFVTFVCFYKTTFLFSP